MAATEKPDASEVQAAAAKLKTQTQAARQRLPTAEDIKTEKEQSGDVRAKA